MKLKNKFFAMLISSSIITSSVILGSFFVNNFDKNSNSLVTKNTRSVVAEPTPESGADGNTGETGGGGSSSGSGLGSSSSGSEGNGSGGSSGGGSSTGNNSNLNGEDKSVTADWKYTPETTSKTNTKQDITKWEHYGKLKPEQVTGEHIKSLLTFNFVNPLVTIEILEIDSIKGVVDFQIKQQKNVYENGQIKETKEYLVPVPTSSSGEQPQTWKKQQENQSNTRWSTSQFKNIFIQDKYNFAWRSDEEIAEFLRDANDAYSDTGGISFDSLTDELIILNLFKQGDGYKLPPKDKITIKKESLPSSTSQYANETSTTIDANDKKYGAVKIGVEFNTNQDTDWVNDKKPTGQSRIIRGLMSTESGVSTTMDLVSISASELSNLEIDPASEVFKDYLMSNESKIGDLYASELVNINSSNDSNALLNLLTKGTYLKTTPTTPPLSIQYYGLKHTDTNFQSTTKLSKEIIDKISFKSVTGIADDSKGSLTLSVSYSYFDVFTDKIVDETSTIEYPEGTFKKNPDAGKVLSFQWKDNETLVGVTSSYDIVNSLRKIDDLFNESKISEEEKRINKVALSNQFFNGSDDAYEKGLPQNDNGSFQDLRDVDISYQSGTKKENNEYVPNTAGDTSITVNLHFKSWSGLSNGSSDGFKTSKTFKLKSYKNQLQNIVWADEKTVVDSIESIYGEGKKDNITKVNTISVNKVIDDLYTQKIDISNFVTGVSSSDKVVFISDPMVGSLTISIENSKGETSSKVYSCFKTESSNQVTQFSWLSENDVSEKLLSTSLDDVTVQMVIDEYLSKIDMFKDENINPEHVVLEKDTITNTLKVTVNINKFDQNINNQTKNFSVQIRGFVNHKLVDANSYKAPLDLTIVLSVVFAIVVIGITGGVFGWLVNKSVKLKKIEKTKSYK